MNSNTDYHNKTPPSSEETTQEQEIASRRSALAGRIPKHKPKIVLQYISNVGWGSGQKVPKPPDPKVTTSVTTEPVARVVIPPKQWIPPTAQETWEEQLMKAQQARHTKYKKDLEYLTEKYNQCPHRFSHKKERRKLDFIHHMTSLKKLEGKAYLTGAVKVLKNKQCSTLRIMLTHYPLTEIPIDYLIAAVEDSSLPQHDRDKIFRHLIKLNRKLPIEAATHERLNEREQSFPLLNGKKAKKHEIIAPPTKILHAELEEKQIQLQSLVSVNKKIIKRLTMYTIEYVQESFEELVESLESGRYKSLNLYFMTFNTEYHLTVPTHILHKSKFVAHVIPDGFHPILYDNIQFYLIFLNKYPPIIAMLIHLYFYPFKSTSFLDIPEKLRNRLNMSIQTDKELEHYARLLNEAQRSFLMDLLFAAIPYTRTEHTDILARFAFVFKLKEVDDVYQNIKTYLNDTGPKTTLGLRNFEPLNYKKYLEEQGYHLYASNDGFTIEKISQKQYTKDESGWKHIQKEQVIIIKQRVNGILCNETPLSMPDFGRFLRTGNIGSDIEFFRSRYQKSNVKGLTRKVRKTLTIELNAKTKLKPNWYVFKPVEKHYKDTFQFAGEVIAKHYTDLDERHMNAKDRYFKSQFEEWESTIEVKVPKGAGFRQNTNQEVLGAPKHYKKKSKKFSNPRSKLTLAETIYQMLPGPELVAGEPLMLTRLELMRHISVSEFDLLRQKPFYQSVLTNDGRYTRHLKTIMTDDKVIPLIYEDLVDKQEDRVKEQLRTFKGERNYIRDGLAIFTETHIQPAFFPNKVFIINPYGPRHQPVQSYYESKDLAPKSGRQFRCHPTEENPVIVDERKDDIIAIYLYQPNDQNLPLLVEKLYELWETRKVETYSTVFFDMEEWGLNLNQMSVVFGRLFKTIPLHFCLFTSAELMAHQLNIRTPEIKYRNAQHPSMRRASIIKTLRFEKAANTITPIPEEKEEEEKAQVQEKLEILEDSKSTKADKKEALEALERICGKIKPTAMQIPTDDEIRQVLGGQTLAELKQKWAKSYRDEEEEVKFDPEQYQPNDKSPLKSKFSEVIPTKAQILNAIKERCLLDEAFKAYEKSRKRVECDCDLRPRRVWMKEYAPSYVIKSESKLEEHILQMRETFLGSLKVSNFCDRGQKEPLVNDIGMTIEHLLTPMFDKHARATIDAQIEHFMNHDHKPFKYINEEIIPQCTCDARFNNDEIPDDDEEEDTKSETPSSNPSQSEQSEEYFDPMTDHQLELLGKQFNIIVQGTQVCKANSRNCPGFQEGKCNLVHNDLEYIYVTKSEYASYMTNNKLPAIFTKLLGHDQCTYDFNESDPQSLDKFVRGLLNREASNLINADHILVDPYNESFQIIYNRLDKSPVSTMLTDFCNRVAQFKTDLCAYKKEKINPILQSEDLRLEDYYYHTSTATIEFPDWAHIMWIKPKKNILEGTREHSMAKKAAIVNYTLDDKDEEFTVDMFEFLITLKLVITQSSKITVVSVMARKEYWHECLNSLFMTFPITFQRSEPGRYILNYLTKVDTEVLGMMRAQPPPQPVPILLYPILPRATIPTDGYRIKSSFYKSPGYTAPEFLTILRITDEVLHQHPQITHPVTTFTPVYPVMGLPSQNTLDLACLNMTDLIENETDLLNTHQQNQIANIIDTLYARPDLQLVRSCQVKLRGTRPAFETNDELMNYIAMLRGLRFRTLMGVNGDNSQCGDIATIYLGLLQMHPWYLEHFWDFFDHFYTPHVLSKRHRQLWNKDPNAPTLISDTNDYAKEVNFNGDAGKLVIFDMENGAHAMLADTYTFDPRLAGTVFRFYVPELMDIGKYLERVGESTWLGSLYAIATDSVLLTNATVDSTVPIYCRDMITRVGPINVVEAVKDNVINPAEHTMIKNCDYLEAPEHISSFDFDGYNYVRSDNTFYCAKLNKAYRISPFDYGFGRVSCLSYNGSRDSPFQVNAYSVTVVDSNHLADGVSAIKVLKTRSYEKPYYRFPRIMSKDLPVSIRQCFKGKIAFLSRRSLFDPVVYEKIVVGLNSMHKITKIGDEALLPKICTYMSTMVVQHKMRVKPTERAFTYLILEAMISRLQDQIVMDAFNDSLLKSMIHWIKSTAINMTNMFGIRSPWPVIKLYKHPIPSVIGSPRTVYDDQPFDPSVNIDQTVLEKLNGPQPINNIQLYQSKLEMAKNKPLSRKALQDYIPELLTRSEPWQAPYTNLHYGNLDLHFLPNKVEPTVLATIGAMLFRQGAASVFPDKKFMRMLKRSEPFQIISEWMMSGTNHLPLEECQFQSYIKTREPNLRRMLADGYLKFKCTSRFKKTTELFPKYDEKLFQGSSIKARIICNPSPEVKACCGHMAWVLMQSLHYIKKEDTLRMLRKLNVEITERIAKRWEQVPMVHAVTKQGMERMLENVLNTFDDPIMIETDQVKHDAHQNGELLEADRIMFNKEIHHLGPLLGYNLDQIRALQGMVNLKRTRFVMYGNNRIPVIFGTTDHTVNSGKPFKTTLGNTCRLSLFHMTQLARHNLLQDAFFFYSGDDSIMIIESNRLMHLLPLYEETYAMGDLHMDQIHGTGQRIEKTTLSRHKVSFCSRTVVYNRSLGKVQMTRKCTRVNTTGCWTYSVPLHLTAKDFLRAIKVGISFDAAPEDTTYLNEVLDEAIKAERQSWRDTTSINYENYKKVLKKTNKRQFTFLSEGEAEPLPLEVINKLPLWNLCRAGFTLRGMDTTVFLKNIFNIQSANNMDELKAHQDYYKNTPASGRDTLDFNDFVPIDSQRIFQSLYPESETLGSPSTVPRTPKTKDQPKTVISKKVSKELNLKDLDSDHIDTLEASVVDTVTPTSRNIIVDKLNGRWKDIELSLGVVQNKLDEVLSNQGLSLAIWKNLDNTMNASDSESSEDELEVKPPDRAPINRDNYYLFAGTPNKTDALVTYFSALTKKNPDFNLLTIHKQRLRGLRLCQYLAFACTYIHQYEEIAPIPHLIQEVGTQWGLAVQEDRIRRKEEVDTQKEARRKQKELERFRQQIERHYDILNVGRDPDSSSEEEKVPLVESENDEIIGLPKVKQKYTAAQIAAYKRRKRRLKNKRKKAKKAIKMVKKGAGYVKKFRKNPTGTLAGGLIKASTYAAEASIHAAINRHAPKHLRSSLAKVTSAAFTHEMNCVDKIAKLIANPRAFRETVCLASEHKLSKKEVVTDRFTGVIGAQGNGFYAFYPVTIATNNGVITSDQDAEYNVISNDTTEATESGSPYSSAVMSTTSNPDMGNSRIIAIYIQVAITGKNENKAGIVTFARGKLGTSLNGKDHAALLEDSEYVSYPATNRTVFEHLWFCEKNDGSKLNQFEFSNILEKTSNTNRVWSDTTDGYNLAAYLTGMTPGTSFTITLKWWGEWTGTSFKTTGTETVNKMDIDQIRSAYLSMWQDLDRGALNH